MGNLNNQVDNLQKIISALATSAELTRQQLVLATEKSNELLSEINRAANAAHDTDLQLFLNKITILLQQLHQIAQDGSTTTLQNLPDPQHILQELNQAYSQHIAPMLQEIQKDDKIENFSMVASLGIEVFKCSTNVYQNFHLMNREEKIAATLGIVLMFAGIGMLIAATLNPATVPAVAAIAVITLGCYLCKRAIARHTAEKSTLETSQSADQVLEHVDQISKKRGISNYSRQLLSFAFSYGSGPTANELAPQQQPAAKSPSLLTRLKAGWDSFMNPPNPG